MGYNDSVLVKLTANHNQNSYPASSCLSASLPFTQTCLSKLSEAGHFGIKNTGVFSTRFFSISKDALPDPMIIPALSLVTGIFPSDNI